MILFHAAQSRDYRCDSRPSDHSAPVAPLAHFASAGKHLHEKQLSYLMNSSTFFATSGRKLRFVVATGPRVNSGSSAIVILMVSTWIYDLDLFFPSQVSYKFLLLTNHGILAPEDLAIHEERWTPANPRAMSVRRECRSSPPKISDMTQEMKILCTSMATENWSHPVGFTVSWHFIFWSLQLLPCSVLTAKPKSWNPSMMQVFPNGRRKPSFYLFAFPCFDESPPVENEQMNFNH